jgi:pyruvate dehydrogenase E2 component (dihydrolipoamide acetyltransferase)
LATTVTLPQIGYETTGATLVRWLKAQGEPVSAGEALAEVETAKAVVEVEADASGVLLRHLAAEGARVAVGSPLAEVGSPGEAPAGSGAPDARARPLPERAPIPAPPGLRGAYPPRQPDADGRIVLGPLGEAIARRTQATMADAPHFTLTVRIDMTDALALRKRLNADQREARVGVNDLITKAVALALVRHPVYNSTFQGDHLRVSPHVNVGMAVAMPGGLAVPALVDADRKTLAQLAGESRGLVERLRSGVLRADEYTGTFSVSNLGMFGVDAFSAVIVEPAVGVLAVGAVAPTPWAVNGEVQVRQVMSATLSTDHRAAHGAEAAAFAGEIKRLLEHPEGLLP